MTSKISPEELAVLGIDEAAFAEADARRERARDWTREVLLTDEQIRARAAAETPGRFNVISLAAWIALAERAGVAHIPAREIHRLPVEVFMGAMDQDPEMGPRMDAAETAIIEALGPGDMLRFDQVAPGEIKAERSAGQEIGNGTFFNSRTGKPMLCIYEDRFYTTLMDHGGDDIRAFARPRVDPVLIDGEFQGDTGQWPAEFRIFIEDGRVVGLSNYYPQVAMDPERFAGAARDALRKGQAMIDTMASLHLGVGNARLCADEGAPEGALRPDWVPSAWAAQDFTLDFFAISEEETLFLEGGPAGMRAAHPCCFLQPGRAIDADFLKGAVFSETGPIHSLCDFQ